eukprot:5564906-Amphidinium_carterae.1
MRRMELYGPENLACWLRCFKVLKCTLIMLGEVEPSGLDMYADHIIEMVSRGFDIPSRCPMQAGVDGAAAQKR